MDWINWCEQLLATARDGAVLGPWEELNKDFYQAFVQEGRWNMYVEGIGNTLKVAVLALVLGFVLGLLVAVVRTFHDQRREEKSSILLGVLNFLCKIYTTVIRGTPMMVQLLIMGFVIFKSSRNLVGIAALAFGINSGAYVAEIIRGGLMSVDSGQMEAGRSLGLNYVKTMWYIIIPQAIKNILPALGNELITLLKETSVCGFIGLADLTKGAMIVQSRTYAPYMPYISIAVIYLVLVLALTGLLNLLERRLRASDRR